MFATDKQGLYRIPAGGGAASKIAVEGFSAEDSPQYSFPYFLPDDQHFLLLVTLGATNRKLYVASIDGGKPSLIAEGTSAALYSPPGFILYQRDSTLMAQRFDATRNATAGNAVPIAEGLPRDSGMGSSSASVSNEGTLVFNLTPPEVRAQLAWYDRSGKRTALVGGLDHYMQFRLSPDERRIVFMRTGTNVDLWLLELSTGISSRFTFTPASDGDPVWSPDGTRIAFWSERKNKREIFVKALGASEESPVLENVTGLVEDWTKDNRLVFRPNGPVQVVTVGKNEKPVTVYKDETEGVHPSPDVHWVAFSSRESGSGPEVYIASFPDFSGKRQISSGGGAQPFWRADSKELFFLTPDAKLMSVDVKAGPSGIETSAPRVLFQTKVSALDYLDQYSPSADGQKFLMFEATEARKNPTTTVVLNWASDLK